MTFWCVAIDAGERTAHVAQLAERVLGKDEVTSSILVVGSSDIRDRRQDTVGGR